MDINKIRNVCKSLSKIINYSHELYLYGSYAKSKETPNSDIDIAIFYPERDMNNGEELAKYMMDESQQYANYLEVNLKKEIHLELMNDSPSIIEFVEEDGILMSNKYMRSNL